MSMKTRLKQPHVMQMIGLALLVVASAVRQLMQSGHGASDGLVGLLYGAAIGALLLSLWLRGRGAGEQR